MIIKIKYLLTPSYIYICMYLDMKSFDQFLFSFFLFCLFDELLDRSLPIRMVII
jgi:hypothetical protein